MTPPTGAATAGREMDALVAEQIMGYVWGRSDTPPAGYSGPNGHLLSPWQWLSRGDFARFVPAVGNETRFLDNIPKFSADIASAMLVVDAMQKYSCDFTLEKAGLAWYADFRSGQGTGDTPALAICKAALFAAASQRDDNGQ